MAFLLVDPVAVGLKLLWVDQIDLVSTPSTLQSTEGPRGANLNSFGSFV